MPRKIVPYLGFLCDSSREVFHLIPEKKKNFLALIEKPSHVQRSLSKASKMWLANVSFSLVVPGALLFTKETNNAVSKALCTSSPIKLYEALREEISYWLFLRAWDDPLPWRDERHIRISLATDASASGWGGSVTLGDRTAETADYWTKEEQELDISVKKALALDKVLRGSCWVDTTTYCFPLLAIGQGSQPVGSIGSIIGNRHSSCHG